MQHELSVVLCCTLLTPLPPLLLLTPPSLFSLCSRPPPPSPPAAHPSLPLFPLLTPSPPFPPSSPAHPSLPFLLTVAVLAAGTTGGHVVLWQYQNLPSVVLSSPTAHGEPSPQWDHLATTSLKGPVVQLKVRPHPPCPPTAGWPHMRVCCPLPPVQWSRASGLLAVNASRSVHVLSREVLNSHYNEQVFLPVYVLCVCVCLLYLLTFTVLSRICLCVCPGVCCSDLPK